MRLQKWGRAMRSAADSAPRFIRGSGPPSAGLARQNRAGFGSSTMPTRCKRRQTPGSSDFTSSSGFIPRECAGESAARSAPPRRPRGSKRELRTNKATRHLQIRRDHAVVRRLSGSRVRLRPVDRRRCNGRQHRVHGPARPQEDVVQRLDEGVHGGAHGLGISEIRKVRLFAVGQHVGRLQREALLLMRTSPRQYPRPASSASDRRILQIMNLASITGSRHHKA